MRYSLAAVVAASTLVAAQQTSAPNLQGTWSTKSNKTLTGPGFFDPFQEELIEPERTGISYSFTDDGHYEEAYYRAIPNPANPACPSAIMQWQHGSFTFNPSNGSLSLTPIAVDGRQLLSSPCEGSNSIYTRYNQTELFDRYEYLIDPYHNIPRLNLYKFDGSPLNPMYLVFNPPQMLPTTTLKPLTTASATAGATSGSKLKRSLDHEVPLNWKAKLESKEGVGHVVHHINADRLWWLGLGLTGIGGLLYMGPRRMGIQI